MGTLDTRPNREGEPERDDRADFSDVRSGGSSTAPDAEIERKPSSETTRRYTVVAGDSLSEIAKREYGDGNQWRRIYEANKDKIENPDLIYPGQELTIPPR